MQCPNCNNTVPDTANVCGYCGTRLRAPAPVQPPPQPVSPPTTSPPPMQYSPAPAPVSRAMPVETAPRPKSRATAIVIRLVVVACVLIVAAAAVWAYFFSDINIMLGSASPTVVVSQPQMEVVATSQPPAEATPFQQPPTPTSIQKTTSRVSVEPLGPENQGEIPTVGSLKDEQNNINISADQAVFITWGWCATTPEILRQNMEHITISFMFNDETLPISQFYKSDSTNSDGQFCQKYSGVIRSWPVGQHTLEYLMIFDTAVNDGISEYPKGEISHHMYTINVSP